MANAPTQVLSRVLLASVFVGLGLSRLLIAAGVLDGGGATIGNGALVFSVIELALGLLLAFGWKARLLALLLAALLAVDALVSHQFWAVAAAARQDQLLHFLKNVALIGGLLLLSDVAPQRQKRRFR
jgi:putative oxidoreductase